MSGTRPGEYLSIAANQRVKREDEETWIERLQRLGDAMADAIEARWSGPGGCNCEVCSTAKAWRKAEAV